MKPITQSLILLSILTGLLLTGCGRAANIGTDDTSTNQLNFTENSSDQDTSAHAENVPRHEDGRALVTISDLAVNAEISKAITDFNKSNPDYYVEILTKETSQSFSDYKDRETIELSTGKGPDLFTNNLNSSFTTYVEKGIMEDLMPYIERDLNPEDFLECSLYAYEKDGKVYALEPSFTITTLLGSQEILGERSSWNFAELKALMEAHSEITLFESSALDAGDFLRTYLIQGNSAYADYDTLKEVIAFDKAYHGSLPEDVMPVPGENVMVVSLGINDPLDLIDYEVLYGKELVPIGYVNEAHSGNYHEGQALSINSASKQKEGAWAFLCFLLSEEFQRENITSFSPLKVIFEEQLAYYAAPLTYSVYIEELGEEVMITQKHLLPRASNALYNGTAEIECATEEQIQKIRDMVENSRSNCFFWDETAGTIISEEAAYYFNNKRDLDDVIDAIQNRMNIYLSEKQ